MNKLLPTTMQMRIGGTESKEDDRFSRHEEAKMMELASSGPEQEGKSPGAGYAADLLRL